ncbi:3-oxoacyl-ACP reductase [Caballeronia catudaia]|uniref:3-oxoacyl-ACP reductase n=1 Tax=Caballeronia catudaia TaxID=1777136 RepID=A0A158AYD3_9BURK|nr:alpha/beta hydrolase [Caballeronia catudaia]SAK62968.1 3-oxoacyl-ACP reductase [Caballeronia catudaia]
MNTFSVDESGNILRYLDLYAGEEPLLFIHGLGCASSSDYPPVVASDAYFKGRSLLIDLMGAGFSDKPADGKFASDDQAAVLSRFIAQQGFARVNLFGHSAGAFIALKLAQRLTAQVRAVILCEPGLTDYGVTMLSNITAQSEEQFVTEGFSAFLAQLKAQGTNDAWLGPFSVASPYAIYQWAQSALQDNAENWLDDLANLKATKGVILSENATSDEIAKFEEAGCAVELVANAEHMIAYDNPDGLALAISKFID